MTKQCKGLKFLDQRGCWDVDDKILQEKYPGLKILGPRMENCYWKVFFAPGRDGRNPFFSAEIQNADENSFWDECSDDDSIYSWEDFTDDDYFAIGSDNEAIWDDDHALEGLEVRFYGGVFGEGFAGLDWPESP
ncbi:hypothetical protein VPH35_056047 [Triticum aestivum]|uniref:Uncharacterized protein n=1 Tax=Triticum turgidum subsp. durum TaxID=4567 RepID=A0A9R1QZN9_TRITD|nr:unnamed protein product [Triticum turgidum subsp. durum]